MNDIITTQGGVPVTTTIAIAEGLLLKHKNVLGLVRRYVADLEEFGGVAFETRPFGTAGGIQHMEVAILNEQQSTLLMTYMRNTDIVRSFKKRLVMAFWEMNRTQAVASPCQVEAYIADLRKQAQAGAAAQHELTRLLGGSPPKAKALPAIHGEPRIFRCASPTATLQPSSRIPIIRNCPIANTSSKWVPVKEMARYVNVTSYGIWNALWRFGLVEWDGYPTTAGLCAGVRLSGPEGEPDIEVLPCRVLNIISAPRTQFNPRSGEDEPVYTC